MQKSKLTYAQMYYAKIKAKEYGITVDQYLANKGKRPYNIKKGTKVAKTEEVSLDRVVKLSDLNVSDNKYSESFLTAERFFVTVDGENTGLDNTKSFANALGLDKLKDIK